MNQPLPKPTSTSVVRYVSLGCVLLSLIISCTILFRPRPQPVTQVALTAQPLPKAREATHEEVVQACAPCHDYPSPDLFPRAAWKAEVVRGLTFFRQAHLKGEPTAGSVIAYYENRAPEKLPPLEPTKESAPFPVRFERLGFRPPGQPQPPGMANVHFVNLSDEKKLDVVACDMRHSKVLLLRPYEAEPKLEVLSELIANPAHSEVVDLDSDGIKDLIIANLGSPVPTEQRVGSVVWLRGTADHHFVPITLAGDLGRVADVQAADFDGDGDLDLVAAVFGRLAVGEIILLENQTTDPEKPNFVRKVLDKRHGSIHVPIADLNGDGRPDFVALISQEHEAVVAFLNTGGGHFEQKDIYRAPHPAYGSSGIQLVDLDRDGDLDVLFTNGDVLDSDLLRPYHSVQWLENRGGFPFVHHHLTYMYGVHRAVAGDLDGDGDLDIVATSFLPGAFYVDARKQMGLDSIAILEQTSPGKFERHSLEKVTCDHATCDLGDYDADGRLDLVVGNMFAPDPSDSSGNPPEVDWIMIEHNQGTMPAK